MRAVCERFSDWSETGISYAGSAAVISWNLASAVQGLRLLLVGSHRLLIAGSRDTHRTLTAIFCVIGNRKFLF